MSKAMIYCGYSALLLPNAKFFFHTDSKLGRNVKLSLLFGDVITIDYISKMNSRKPLIVTLFT